MSKKNKPAVDMAGPSRRAINFEFRSAPAAEGQARTISGHGSVFDTLSQDLGGFREIIHSGAFDDALAGSDIRCLFNHDANLILGRVASGTLRVNATATGLEYSCDMPDVSYANDLQVSIDRGDVTQSSFAFTMDWSDERVEDNPDGSYEWEYDSNRGWTLHIYRVTELFDVSPVTYPAYLAADVRQARSAFGVAMQRRIDDEKRKAEQEEAEKQAAADQIKQADQARSRAIHVRKVRAFN